MYIECVCVWGGGGGVCMYVLIKTILHEYIYVEWCAQV